MKTRLSIIVAALFVLSLPLGAFAMSHEKGEMEHKGHEHMEKMEHKDHDDHKGHDDHSGHGHGSMAAKGDMIVLGDDSDDDVKAMAHLKDVSEAMSKMGMDTTHHFMVMFVDEKTGEPINEGTVAVKFEGPNDRESGPVKLMGMQGHFGADLSLTEKGKYEFKVGTKLPDGEKRQFEFKYELQ